MGTPGGLSEVQAATEEIQEMVNKMKPVVEEKAGKNFDMFKAISYRTQVVAGTNYFVKVQVCGDSFVELRIYRSLENEFELSAIKEGLDEDSEITFI